MSIEYGCSYLDNYELVSSLKRIEPTNEILTWNLANTNDVAKDTAKELISLAFKEIELHINPIRFKYVNSFKDAHIKIVFTPKNQKLNFKDEAGNLINIDSPFDFDGQFGTLAVGFYPVDGEFRGLLIFDEDEIWSNRHNTETGEIDLQTVALHEILHVLGLKHSNVKKAVMYSTYDGERRIMHQDDINGIRKIYKDLLLGYIEPKQNILQKIIDFLKKLFNIE